MKRLLLLTLGLLTVVLVACGGGDKEPARSDAEPDATATAVTGTSDSPETDSESEIDEASDDDASVQDGEIEVEVSPDSSSGLLNQVFGLGVGGVTGEGWSEYPGAQEGSGELEPYLLTIDDLPPGFQSMGSFSFNMPEDVSEDFPGGEMSAAMFMSGDLEAGEPGTMLMAMVMQPDDPAAVETLADELGSFSEDEIRETFGADSEMLGIEIRDIEQLDVSGLGDNAAGLGLTMDMSAFFEQLDDLYVEDIGPTGDELAQIQQLMVMRMRMYMFGAGDKVGMLMQIGFGDSDLAEDAGLAQTLYGNLQ